MRLKSVLFLCTVLLLFSCREQNRPAGKGGNHTANLDTLLDKYWEEKMILFPLEATANGDNRYNDRMTITISGSFRDTLNNFYTRYLNALKDIDTASLKEEEELLSYRLFNYEMQMGLEGLKYPSHLMPVNQFWGLTLEMPQLGSGTGNQPFKTVADYDNWLKRASAFPAWTAVAIANMREGITKGWTLPRVLVVKVLPQLKSMLVTPQKSIFYGPITSMPDSFSVADKARLTKAYTHMIAQQMIPAYQQLHDFMKDEYLPAARTTTGISAIPGGNDYYNYLIETWTTTRLTPDSIYNLGQAEVMHLEQEMNRVKDESGFKGDLHAFFDYLNKDPRFFPFTTAKQVIDSFWAIKKQEEPYLKQLFNHTPQSPFTIRQTEAFRAASASAEYNPPSADGSRPGIFYTPILNPVTFNAVGMETLFLHEAIPGHHYQISLQQENKNLPRFRKFLWYGSYGEGWALYSESLGKELGLFRNQYQYFGHLSDAMHRAIRLVVDAGMHTKGMTREQAIDFMVAHERITRDEATAEIERYMAIPAQALSYKIGQLTIRSERTKYEQLLGDKFRIATFHDEVLKHGCVPLNILAENLALWAKKQP
jgi:uncharacterized protein (DUF885 family)